MSEYTYSDVIIDPNDKRVKIGEKYWSSCTAAKSCIDSANANEPLVELIRITMGVRYPFHIKYSDGVETDCCCLSKPKEPGYVPFDLSKKEAKRLFMREMEKEEYTYKDIIIDPKDSRVKIGEKYWFGYSPNEALRHANNGDELRELSRLNNDNLSDHPFVVYSGDIGANFVAMVKPKELKVTCTLDLDNDEKYQIGYLPNEALPLVTYSKNNNVIMCDPNKLKIELLLKPIEKIR